MNRKQALIIIGGMASLFLSGCAQLVPPHHPQLPLSPGALDGRVRGVLDANALAVDRSPWPCLAALPPEVVIASSWFVVDYRLPTDPHRQQGIAKEVPQLPVSVGDHVEVFPGNCQRGELARIGAILAAELPDAERAGKALDSMQTALVNNISGNLKEAHIAGKQTNVDRVLDIAADGVSRGQPLLLQARPIAKGSRIYQVLIIGNPKDVSAENAETFFTSFKPT